MLNIGLFLSVFTAVFSALWLRDLVRSRQDGAAAQLLAKISRQLDETTTVLTEIRQFLNATKGAASSTSMLAEEISRHVQQIAKLRAESEKGQKATSVSAAGQ